MSKIMTFSFDLTDFQFDEAIQRHIVKQIESKSLYELCVQTIDMPLESFVLDLFEEHINDKTLNDSYTKFKSNKFSRTKKRWAASTETAYNNKKKPNASNNYLCHYQNLLLETLEYKNLNIEEKEAELENIDTMISETLEELKEWSLDDEKFLSDFNFFSKMTNNKKKSAFAIDITMIIFETLLNLTEEEKVKGDAHIKDQSFLVPTNMPSIVETSSKTEYFVQEVDDKTGDHLYTWTYEDKKGYSITYMHDKAYLNWLGLIDDEPIDMVHSPSNKLAKIDDKNELVIRLPFFDLVDYQILAALLNYQQTSFVLNRPINAKTRDLVMAIYNNDSASNYKNIYNRLKKMQSLKGHEEIIDQDTQTKSTRVFQFLSSLEIVEPVNQPAYVLVSFDEKYRDNYLNEQTYRIYKNQLTAVKKETRKMIMYLQKLRFDLFTNTRLHSTADHDREDQLRLTHYDFLRNVKIDLKQKKRQRELIVKSLDELVEKQIILKKYVADKDNYLITFQPLDRVELDDIVRNSEDINPIPILTPRIDK